MSERRGPLDTALDLAVYAPLGLVLERRRIVDELAERGRRQIQFAKMLGRTAFSVTVDDIREAFRSPDGDAAPSFDPPELVAADRVREEDRPTPGPAAPTTDLADTALSAADLAIPDYESLAAKQVVRRLSGLSPDELEDVRVYETANRGRRTILGRIDQLQS